MTEDEAVQTLHEAHYPEDYTMPSKGDDMELRHANFIIHRIWVKKAIRGYAALGIMKLDQVKAKPKLESVKDLASPGG